ncbi:phosphatidate cytidylyltransferase-like [Leptopilina heterotoma]|uniref:phosphatidate cytidylyltransferase-like n=1 Tax=Leptopilina heterotoma TaxID=63436 RepID=UPI001CA7DEAD|nr:phosphatidate cytidylyltransferase-like [Leptopilina heterotoma]
MIARIVEEHLGEDIRKLKIRILSGLVLVKLFVVGILWLKPLFHLLMILVAIGMLTEWYNMTHSSSLHSLLGLIIIPVPISLLILLSTDDTKNWLIMLYFGIIWSADGFAMIGGKVFKGLKLAPKISPRKTWSGLISGVLASSLVAVLISLSPNFQIESYYFSNKVYLFLFGCVMALIGQLSDLFISYFKRKFKVKDSGHLIPGHGGVLDRFDSIILTAPLLFLINLYL